MRVVIEIPNSIYNTIESDEVISREQLMILQKHILDGIVLPEQHGDLVDRNEIRITNYEIFTNDFKEALKLLIERIRNAPTILEGTVKE